MKMYYQLAIALSLLLFVPSIASAQAEKSQNSTVKKPSEAKKSPERGKISVKNEAFVWKTDKSKDGKKEEKKLVPAVTVVPGEFVTFIITYKNNGNESATDVVITNPIPANMTYSDAQAESGETITVSVDGGKQFDKLDKLTVVSNTKDKKELKRAAVPADVTHVRWRLEKALEPNKEGKVKLIAVLN